MIFSIFSKIISFSILVPFISELITSCDIHTLLNLTFKSEYQRINTNYTKEGKKYINLPVHLIQKIILKAVPCRFFFKSHLRIMKLQYDISYRKSIIFLIIYQQMTNVLQTIENIVI